MNRAVVFAGSAVLTAVALWACGMENALVGGECADGFALAGERCVPIAVVPGGPDGSSTDGGRLDGSDPDGTGDGAASDSGLTDGAANDAEGGTGLVCTPPLVNCGGVCVDTTNDPLNCGVCGNVCPSLLCSNSKCDGTVAGHIVVFGHDYQGTFSGAQKKALENAAVLAPGGTAVRIRSYEQYANGTAVSQVKNVITNALQAQGRTPAFTVATQPADVAPAMTNSNTDLLVVYDQVNAPAGMLGVLGGAWATSLSTFTHNGGVVIVLDARGGAEPQMAAFLTNSLLLDVASETPVAVGTPLFDVASQDAVGQGLVSPYGAGQNTVQFACNEANAGTVTYVVVNSTVDAASPPPVIIHKVTP